MSKGIYDSRGDTIIEVLIAVAIISLVLVVSYAAANRNTRQLQNTQEREQAQHLVATQIEYLRQAGSMTDGTGADCFDVQNPTNIGKEVNGAACKVSATGSGATYILSVKGPSPSSPGSAYTIQAQWVGLGAQSNSDISNVTMYYRLQ